MMNLTGKVALVTGGSRGIGAAVCRALAAEGATVALTYTNSEDKAEAVAAQLREMGCKVTAIQADAGIPEQVTAAVNETYATFGRLDILVNNAGNFVTGKLGELTVDDFERSMAVNVRGVFVAINQAAQYLPDGGQIINIGSSLASYVGRPGISLYAISKAALVGLTKGAARDFGERRITVNLVQPGPINTDMNPQDSERAAASLAKMALPAYGQPVDVAACVVFLAGEGGRYITGTSLNVDGGINA
ncbi:3-oxoacyl-ACP reductase family protein [Enterobacter ludwigii]|uniref:SDR family NAD(P)-dependent oxidoreductase n=1 Tax=Enterobacter ludwigii TaxID=299767 RepID=UPI002B4BC15A|nr:3-oxoacyl-ACP reductase family protein [Enterobacter ludwigii]WRM04101.1 3-oxoacyl-ACP reductase family protein [Enterobacter ludwigii]